MANTTFTSTDILDLMGSVHGYRLAPHARERLTHKLAKLLAEAKPELPQPQGRTLTEPPF